MSTGGIFQLVANDGRIDQLLLNSNSLRDNIAKIKAARTAAGQSPNPTLADIERSHILFIHVRHKPYAALACQYFKLSQSNVTFGSPVQLSIPQYGDFFADMVVNVVIPAPTVSIVGTPSDATADVPVYRHCDYPGERLFDKVSFEVNSNPLDTYTSDSYVFYRQFRVSQDKMIAWKRCMGQEVPCKATPAWSATATAPSGMRLTQDVYNGYQTYKAQHQDLNLWIPLLFWFNQDFRLAFPSVSVPYGQRYLKFDITQASNIYRCILNPSSTTSNLTNPTYVPSIIQTFDLYINNIFLLPEIHEIFIERVAFTLIRVHRQHTQNLNKSSDSILLQQLKWPVESIIFGFRPQANTDANSSHLTDQGTQVSAASGLMDDWHRFAQVTTTTTAAVMGADGSKLTVRDVQPHITTLNLTAHAVDLFGVYPAKFFNSYIPLQFGGHNVTAPTDPGVYMYSFALHPFQYQPSGHFNASRARELYLNYTSSLISSDSTATFVLEAQTINFLLVSEGSASVRYST
jgi:hypothetical protein